jgi:hypothetical protein
MHFLTDDVKGRLAVEVVYFEYSREVHQLRRMEDGDQGQVALSPHLLKMRQDAQGMWLYLEIKPRSTSIDKAVSSWPISLPREGARIRSHSPRSSVMRVDTVREGVWQIIS